MIDPMAGRFRALIAALVVLIVALCGALYVAAHSMTSGTPHSLISLNVAELPDSAGGAGGAAPVDLFDKAITDLSTEYYKPFNPRAPFRGGTAAIDKYLEANHVKHPKLPTEFATGDPEQDAQTLAHDVAYAEHTYGKRLGADGATDLTEAGLSGVMDSVDDPYTVYLTPKEIQSLNESLNGGDFGGIGVYILQLKDGDVLLQPIDGAPAARAGMKPGAIVDTVDGRKVHGVPIDIVERWIRGAQGTQVVLTTHQYKSTAERRFTITREIIHVPTVSKHMENGYEYIRLSDFGITSPAEMKSALLYGRKHNAKGYILDLRYNGGGLVEAAVKISSLFIPQGTIVSTVDREGHRQIEEALGDAIGGVQPLVVLVNKYTASASEITAGALQDYHAATLVGVKTFGKGVIQSIYDMPDGGALKITTASYLTPLGREIQHKGIVPDVIVPQSDDVPLDTPADKQLAAAKAKLAQLLK
ncbi:MAG TPA: S41 family peptidase [Candidatus Baltobacteraceae bacterium]|nr:S41 family peptidase [Candidatus Baltobacteraceae bacterium]